jgi:hygromycin-B 7''-O-kinase
MALPALPYPGPDASDESAWDALLGDEAALAAGVAAVCARHRLGGLPVQRYDSGSLPVYAIGSTHVLKLFPPHEGDHAAIEARTLATVDHALPIPTPRLLAVDTLDGWHCLLMSQLRGRRLVDAWPGLSGLQRDRLAEELGVAVAALHAIDCSALADFQPQWDAFLAAQRGSAVERQRSRRLDPYWLERLPDFLQTWMPAQHDRRALLHTELMREHLLVVADGDRCALSGLFDFEPAMIGAPEYDFASFGLFVACGDGRFLRRALRAYGYRPAQLDAALQCRLMAYAILHRYSNLRWYLERLPAPGATSFEQLAARWWPLA